MKVFIYNHNWEIFTYFIYLLYLIFDLVILGDSLGLTPANDKELAVHALGGCVYLLKEFLLEQQLLAQGCFNTYIPPDFSAANNRAGLNYTNTMVIDAVTIKNLRLFGENSLNSILDRCCTAFGKR